MTRLLSDEMARLKATRLPCRIGHAKPAPLYRIVRTPNSRTRHDEVFIGEPLTEHAAGRMRDSLNAALGELPQYWHVVVPATHALVVSA